MRQHSRTTRRLTLVPTSVEHLRAEMASPDQLGSLLQATVPAGWPPGEYDADAQRFFLGQLLERDESAVGWYGWYAVTREPHTPSPVLMAAGGFLGPPDAQGNVELGYSVHDGWRNQGFATELVQELVAFALEHPSVRRILAHTTTDNAASCAVLRKCGFSDSRAPLDPPGIEFELVRNRVTDH